MKNYLKLSYLLAIIATIAFVSCDSKGEKEGEDEKVDKGPELCDCVHADPDDKELQEACEKKYKLPADASEEEVNDLLKRIDECYENPPVGKEKVVDANTIEADAKTAADFMCKLQTLEIQLSLAENNGEEEKITQLEEDIDIMRDAMKDWSDAMEEVYHKNEAETKLKERMLELLEECDAFTQDDLEKLRGRYTK